MENLDTYFREAVNGKQIIITGGTTGIGREIAVLLTSLGAKCIICGRHQEQIAETINYVQGFTDGVCIGIKADLANGSDIQALFQFADEEFGKVDILINNAALAFGSVMEGSYEDWKYIIDTNLMGYMACCHEAATRMSAAGSGHIINIGSMSADVREENSSVYVASKAGIQGFSEALRKELNPKNIKVSLIEPGAVDTDMQKEDAAGEKSEKISNREMLKAEDIARAVLFCIGQDPRSDVVTLQIRPHLQLI